MKTSTAPCSGLTLLLVLCGFTALEAATGVSKVLSEEPRIEYQEAFLDLSDVERLRRLARKVGLELVDESKTREVSGGEDYCMLNASEASGSAVDEKDWAVVEHFRQRAAAWTKLPLGDTVPVVARWDTWAPGSKLNRSGLLHLDARQRPRHLRTVLLYLSGAAVNSRAQAIHSSPAGFTVFPCVETDDMEPEEAARRQRLCSRAHRHVKLAHERLLDVRKEGLELPPSQQLKFLSEHPELTSLPKTMDGLQPVEWRWTWIHDAVSEQAGKAQMDSLSELAEAMCRGQAPGLRVSPVAGAALLFDGAMPRGKGKRRELQPDWRTWHAGCSPLRGLGPRYTAQLFFDDSPVTLANPQRSQCSAQDAQCAQRHA